MEPQVLTINPLAVLLLAAMVLVALTSTRQNAVKALFTSAAFLPLGQQFVVFGVHFQFFRIVLAACFFRALVRQDFVGFRFNLLDKVFLAWALVGMLCESLRGQPQNAFGFAYNALGTYFVVRFLLSDVNEVTAHLQFLAWVIFGVGLCMFVEFAMHHNPLAVFGGVLEVPEIRDGRVRCQGPFRSSNVAGGFGSTLFPLMAGLWMSGEGRKRAAALGMVGCAAASYFSNSSSPYLCILVSLVGLAMWKIRNRMSLVRRGLVCALIALAIVMKAPLWYVLAKGGDLIGGSSWHRAFIIDLTVHHFSDWWLMGADHTSAWASNFPKLAIDPTQLDITNQYVAQALQGGLLSLLLFITILILCFKIVGQALDCADCVPFHEKLTWALGVTLAAQCTEFFSIYYFDQIQVFLFWLFALFGSLSAFLIHEEETSQEAPASDVLAQISILT